MIKIAVIGTGYVGLVSGTCFAETGNQVICVDNNAEKIQRLSRGEIPIFEPGLDLIFERNTKKGRLKFTLDLASAVQESDIIFLALPTPPGEDGSADLSYVLGVAKQLGGIIKDYKVIVNKSTVPVGTGEKVHSVLAEHLDTDLFDVVSNPEFLREGVAVDDFLKPDRVVIGSNSQRALDKMLELYKPFVRQGNPILTMDIRSAEVTKYAANSYLAARISFMNEIANLCEKVGANVDNVRKGMGSDSRIGKRFLFPGVGYGGSCFPKDVQALARTADQYDYDFKILKSVMTVNSLQKERLTTKILDYFDGDIVGKKIAIWGLAFKPNTDDIREAPALTIIDGLRSKGAKIIAYDPEAMDNVRTIYGDGIEFATNEYNAIKGADALVIVTEWNAFRNPDFNKVMDLLEAPVIFDGRNVFEPNEMKMKGFHYESIGRQKQSNLISRSSNGLS